MLINIAVIFLSIVKLQIEQTFKQMLKFLKKNNRLRSGHIYV